MNALLATATLNLFAPVLIAATAALALSVIGRLVGQRKYESALESTGGAWVPLEADRTEGPLSVAKVQGLSFENSVTLLLSEAETSLVAMAKSAVISAADSAAMTLRASRIYLEEGDLAEC